MAPLPAPAEKPSHRVSDSQSHAKVRPPTQVAVFCAALWPNLQPALTPGEPEDRNFVDVLNSGETIERIPTTLHDALDALAEDDVIRSALPGDLYRVYDWYKRDEWNKFIGQVSDWDVNMYLDCLP